MNELTHHGLVERLKNSGVLQTPEILEAFTAIDRRHFVPPDAVRHAYVDHALPIGFGQTISQPSTVAFMLEHLQPAAEQSVADIGAGSGWQTALLARIVGPAGKVYAVEIVPELLAFCKDNLKRYDFRNVQYVAANARREFPGPDRFDRILVAAAASAVPQTLLRRLAPDGRMVIPVGGPNLQDLVVIQKRGDRVVRRERYPGFVFVPLVEGRD